MYKIMKQSELTSTSDCWIIQMFGIERCETCEFLNTSDCGGEKIREDILSKTDITDNEYI